MLPHSVRERVGPAEALALLPLGYEAVITTVGPGRGLTARPGLAGRGRSRSPGGGAPVGCGGGLAR